MSKFDVMAYGELNRYSALNLKTALDEYVNSQGDLKSVHLGNTIVQIGRDNNSNLAFLSAKMYSIVVEDEAVFLIKFLITQSRYLLVNDVIDRLQSIDRSNDRPLIIADLGNKMMHQVIDHRFTNNKVANRKLAEDKLTLIVDNGDYMSDELAKMWGSFRIDT